METEKQMTLFLKMFNYSFYSCLMNAQHKFLDTQYFSSLDWMAHNVKCRVETKKEAENLISNDITKIIMVETSRAPEAERPSGGAKKARRQSEQSTLKR